MSNSNAKTDTIDYYAIVAGIRPGRSPSIYHKEHRYYWGEFPQAPDYSIYNTTFHKVNPLSHCVDCSRYGQVHYWARVGSVNCPALVVFHFTTEDLVRQIRYYFFGGLLVEDRDSNSMVKITSPDLELFQLVLSGFIFGYLSGHYSFNK